MEKEIFAVGDLIICNHTASFYSHGIAPPLQMNKGYTIQQICLDKEGHQHLDVGLKMGTEINSVTSFETREYLLSPKDQWWCHPSRFHKAKIKEKIMHFKHKKTGAVLHKECFNKLPVAQKTHFATTNEEPTHKYEQSSATHDDDDDGTNFANSFLTLLVAEEVASVVADSFSNDTSSVDTTSNLSFGGGDGGGGGAGDSF